MDWSLGSLGFESSRPLTTDHSTQICQLPLPSPNPLVNLGAHVPLAGANPVTFMDRQSKWSDDIKTCLKSDIPLLTDTILTFSPHKQVLGFERLNGFERFGVPERWSGRICEACSGREFPGSEKFGRNRHSYRVQSVIHQSYSSISAIVISGELEP
ncbi:hypothetical protein AVEN_17905-1 [Araneus ventricosus]|uniref:Uncharacterized protein n=1 Tax=Araneus ventricosus TaxID=182803 RepID=A0A4Y2Q7V2_ARAVE|nr:hypothetical protein AVEN_17905-1 [Araneus ventricosus]